MEELEEIGMVCVYCGCETDNMCCGEMHHEMGYEDKDGNLVLESEIPADKRIKLWHGDCLDLMKEIPDNSIDLCLTDPPYGTTACKWDNVIPFEPMWKELKRIVKDNGAICLFGGNPFQASLIMSNPKMFRCEWIWDKETASNFAVVKYQPLSEHESISVFSVKSHLYYPIKMPRNGSGKSRMKYAHNYKGTDSAYGINREQEPDKFYDPNLRNPRSIIAFNPRKEKRGLHPTQKPVALLEYLIKTYTLENETVLDFTMGSGSTGVAAKNLNRKFIGIEKDEKYFEIAKERINEVNKTQKE